MTMTAKQLAAKMTDPEDPTIGSVEPPVEDAPASDATAEEHEAWQAQREMWAEAHAIYQADAEMGQRERQKLVKEQVAAENAAAEEAAARLAEPEPEDAEPEDAE